MTSRAAGKIQTLFSWAAFSVVIVGVLTAWDDPLSGHLLQAGVLALAAAVLVWTHATGRAAAPHWLVAIPLMCAAWGLLQWRLDLTVYRFETLESAAAWAARAAAAYIAWATFERRQWHKVLNGMLYAAAGIGMVGMFQWFTAHDKVFWLAAMPYGQQVVGPFLNRDHYAAFVELMLPIGLVRALWNPRAGLAHAALAGFLFASVIASGSRAGFALAALEVVALAAAALLRMPGRWRMVGAIAVCIFLFTAVVGSQYLWERLNLPDPFAFRRELLAASVSMIRARPAVGFGLGTWPSVYPAYAVFDPSGAFMNHAHNDWAEWAAEGGVLFDVPLLAMALAVAVFARRALWGLGVAIVFLHSFVDFPLQKPALAILTFFLAGALAANSRTTNAAIGAECARF
ncbi:MAG: O-antigen ligase family protein [Bryobacteraceae bacterium]